MRGSLCLATVWAVLVGASSPPQDHTIFRQDCKGEKNHECLTDIAAFESKVLKDKVCWAVLFQTEEEAAEKYQIVRGNYEKVSDEYEDEPLKFAIVVGMEPLRKRFNPHNKPNLLLVFRWTDDTAEELYHLTALAGLWAPHALDTAIREHLRGNPRQRDLPIGEQKGNKHMPVYWLKRHRHEHWRKDKNRIHPSHKAPSHQQWETWKHHDIGYHGHDEI